MAIAIVLAKFTSLKIHPNIFCNTLPLFHQPRVRDIKVSDSQVTRRALINSRSNRYDPPPCPTQIKQEDPPANQSVFSVPSVVIVFRPLCLVSTFISPKKACGSLVSAHGSREPTGDKEKIFIFSIPAMICRQTRGSPTQPHAKLGIVKHVGPAGPLRCITMSPWI